MLRASAPPVPRWQVWTSTALVFAISTGGVWLILANVEPRSWLGLLKIVVTTTWFYLVLSFAARREWLVK